MSPSEVETVIGKDALQAVETAVSQALINATSAQGPDGCLAVREMLLALLAAAIITPRTGAGERASRDADRLIEIVEASLSASQSVN